MDRRAFLSCLGLLATPLAADAQTAKPWKIGWLGLGTPTDAEPYIRVFMDGIRDLGYAAGQDVVLEPVFANYRADLLPDLARDLVRQHVDVIIAQSNDQIAAAKQATNVIPIIMIVAVNPVGSGFVASLAHPGGNITGTTYDASPDIASKNVELLKQLVPTARRIAVLWDTAFPGLTPYVDATKNAAVRLGATLRLVGVSTRDDLPRALESLSSRRDDAVVVFGSTQFDVSRANIVKGINQSRLPAVYPFRRFVDVGGLISYGSAVGPLYRRAAQFADKIRKGALPGDLPVEQPTSYELVINLKTARALGLTIPQSLLLRADQVIE